MEKQQKEVPEVLKNRVCGSCVYWKGGEELPAEFYDGSLFSLKYGVCERIKPVRSIADDPADAALSDAEGRGINAVLRTTAHFSCVLWIGGCEEGDK